MNTMTKGLVGLVLALPLAAGAASRPATPFTHAELDQMLAPIALYPDSVLSHVLIAATVPDEVEEAAEWSARHPDLRGQAAVDAVAGRDWDPSVKALVAFPEVLERMDEDPDWTADLGEAFLEQEGEVMDRVQVLRDRAYDAGHLESLEHVRVVREREYIYLEPAVAHVVYVPYYDPWWVYGTWWWASYPPHHWAYWGGYPAHHYYGARFYWGVGFHLAPTYYYGSFNWRARQVIVRQPHRYYAPTPGFSGRSIVRRDAHPSTRPHDSRGWRNADTRRRHDGWRHDNRRHDPPRRDDPPRRHNPPRRDDPASRWRRDDGDRPRHEERARSREPRMEHRRNWDEVTRELGARRENRSHDTPRESRRDESRPRGEFPGGSQERRETVQERPRPERAEHDRPPGGHRQSSPQVERRGFDEAPRGESRGRERAQQRQQQRPQGRSRQERER